MLSSIFIFASLIAFSQARSEARRMQVLESRSEVPQGFVFSGAAPPTTTLQLRLALTQSDIPGLHKALYDVSDPDSPHYGQHLTKAEVEKLVAPKPESVEAVNAWLKDNNITTSTNSPAGDWLAFSLPVSKANELLDTEFATYTHEATRKTSTRTLAYSVPEDLKDHIQLIHPTISQVVSFPTSTFVATSLPAPSGLNAAVIPPSCAPPIRPRCILDLYGVPNGTVATHPSNVLAVTGYDNLFANQADLQSFLTLFRPDISSNTTFAVQTIQGGTNPQNISQAGTEPDLDTQYTVGIATGVPVVFVSVGPQGPPGGESFLDTANFFLSENNPPSVVTTSYTHPVESGISPALAKNICNAFAQLGARGTSILFSSGDAGVGGVTNCTTFIPNVPNDCPFVTSVGATTGVNPETAAALSSGGFSNYFSTPSYQQAAVSSYIASLGITYAGLYNRSGRGFPDVSAQGTDVRIVVRGAQALVKGTSCSAPMFAGIVALLNDALLGAGRPPLGFLNPFFYSPRGAAAFTDVTSGSNPGCGTSGFPAAAGWDPVTGLGTPNYEKLKAALGL
ncbi:family S53 protease [Trametes elegans]|nr:family S53 protease [Trametes elegans]